MNRMLAWPRPWASTGITMPSLTEMALVTVVPLASEMPMATPGAGRWGSISKEMSMARSDSPETRCTSLPSCTPVRATALRMRPVPLAMGAACCTTAGVVGAFRLVA
ncbi:hypothetical protein D3C80_1898370 [compost metagenome]